MNAHLQPSPAMPSISIAENADPAGGDDGPAIQIHRRPAAERRPELPSSWPMSDDGPDMRRTGADQECEAIDQDQAAVVERHPVAEDAQTTGESESGDHPIASDFQRPAALDAADEFIFNEDEAPADLYISFGRRLAASGDIYRRPAYASGLVLASRDVNVPPKHIENGNDLVAATVDRVRVTYKSKGKKAGRRIPSHHATIMLRSEIFLRQFRPVDELIRSARYTDSFRLTTPGYNDGGWGQRFLHVGPPARIEKDLDAISRFLDVMDFDTRADRTNSVAAALTVILRNHFPGAKPLILVTGSKSHAGKDTVIQFAAGGTPTTAVSYQETDWAFEAGIVVTLKHNPEAGLLVVENARLGKGRMIASGFLERFVTDAEPTLFSTVAGGPVRRKNHFVVAISTNFGKVSEDLMNRSLPIHLAPTGNVADRQSPIGNPKLEFLPRNRDRIEAELRGMIERWKQAGQPLDGDVRHPFTNWAAVVGGILMVNEFKDFLANYGSRRTEDDPVRRSLGVLGAARSASWLRTSEWVEWVESIGLVKTLIPEADRGSPDGHTRGIGVVLSAHVDETFDVETEDERLSLRLEKARRRFDAGTPTTRYRFSVLSREPIPADRDEE
ncbi:MAG TPA: hypothetical protein VHC22_21890 [Pirellulales bacterium]|nr:hypothetical protein [Pirellulales bacterium]